MPTHRRHSPFNTPATIAPNPITLKYMTLARNRGRTASTITGIKRFAEPLALAGFRPPYVRNHCYAAANGGTS